MTTEVTIEPSGMRVERLILTPEEKAQLRTGVSVLPPAPIDDNYAKAQKAFTEFLSRAGETVSKWPLWKQRVLGGIGHIDKCK